MQFGYLVASSRGERSGLLGDGGGQALHIGLELRDSLFALLHRRFGGGGAGFDALRLGRQLLVELFQVR